MLEIIYGILVAVVIIVLAQVLSKYVSTRLFAASTLVAIAFIYVGFSLKGNPAELIVLEAGIALVFYFMALIGYTSYSSLLAYGIILHGIWDIFHHYAVLIGTDIPSYWPSFCLTVDLIDGIYFLLVFRNQKSTLLK